MPRAPGIFRGLRREKPRTSGFSRGSSRSLTSPVVLFARTLPQKRARPRALRANVVAKSAEPRVLSPHGPGFSRGSSRGLTSNVGLFARDLPQKRASPRALRADVAAKSAEPRVLSPDGSGFSRERSRSEPARRLSPPPAFAAWAPPNLHTERRPSSSRVPSRSERLSACVAD